MFGFYIYKNISKHIVQKSHEHDLSFEVNDFLFFYKKFEKFSNDKIFYQDSSIVIGIDGVLLNSKQLLSNYQVSDIESLAKKLFLEKGIGFVDEFKGEFSGFYYLIKEDQLRVFVNKTVTKNVFYSQFKDSLVFAPSAHHIAKIREKLLCVNKLNFEAAYQLLSFGSVLNENTLIKDVYKIIAGSYILFENRKLHSEKYYDFNNIEIKLFDTKKAINQLNETFITALDLEYKKDIEYNYKHLATLSGGLDSRMNVVLASKMNYKINTFCFSQSNYYDHHISKKIAENYELDYQFFPLENGDYLLNIDDILEINDGLQYYLGSSHYHFALNKIDLKQYGLIHTGQIGDGLLGGFVSFKGKDSILSKTISKKFINKVHNNVDRFNDYRDEEVFKLYHRVFNLTNLGSYMTENMETYLVSPFFDIDFIQTALSIDPSLKLNEKIYINWINQLHPYIADFVWERTKMKPNKLWKTTASLYLNSIRNRFLKYTNQNQFLSMNPVDFWFKNNQNLQKLYQYKFDENISHLDNDLQFSKDAKMYFENGKFIEKATLLTLLIYIGKYNIKV